MTTKRMRDELRALSVADKAMTIAEDASVLTALLDDADALEQARAELVYYKTRLPEVERQVVSIWEEAEDARAELAQQQKDHYLDLAKAMGERDAYARSNEQLRAELAKVAAERDEALARTR